MDLHRTQARRVLTGMLLAGLAALGAAAASAEFAGPFDDELGLDEEQQRVQNNVSLGTIVTLNSTSVASIPLGMVPSAIVSYTAEVSGVAADSGLKFTKAYLVAPDDRALLPNARNQCAYSFDLPQTEAEFQNFLGLWPKLGEDRLFRRNDTPISFGALGVPQIWHANTDVLLSVTSLSAGFDPTAGTSSQEVFVPPGVHEIVWRADTLTYPVWDFVLPAALMPVNAVMEVKFGRIIKKLKLSRGRLPELVGAVDDPALLVRMLNQLNRKIRLFSILEKAAPQLADVGHALTGEYLVERIVEPTKTVSRARVQKFTVYDMLAPAISTSAPDVTLEATDIGGTTFNRYFVDLRDTITATDPCDQPLVVVHDAPEVLPLGVTLVTWTVRDPGPTQPGIDHNGDGIVDENDGYRTDSVVQLITVEDTQAPILVPPPGVVIESDTAVDLDTAALGQPLVVDLADLHPDVTSSTDSIDGIVPPDTRTVITWAAADDALPTPNVATAEQLVTVKTPGSNTPPVAQAASAQTLTSQPVDIVLTGVDNDLLPYSNDPEGPAVPDPLQFRIEQRPQNGEFVAPLKPFFIDDYRTDKVGGLIAYIESRPDAETLMEEYILAVNTNAVPQFLDDEFCAVDEPAPVDFVFEPRYVHVTDEGEEYFFDQFLVCDPNGTGDPEWATYPRISRWGAGNQFLGHVRIDDNGGGVPGEDAVFRIDDEDFVYYVDPSTGGEEVVSIQRCAADFTNTTTTPPFCQSQGFGPVDANDAYPNGGWDPETALVDIERELVYVVAGPTINVFDYRHEDPDNDSSPRHPALRIAALVDDLGSDQVLDVGACGPAGTAQFHPSMEVDSAGNLYVSDNECHRVHKFEASHFDEDGVFVPGDYVGWMGKCTGSNNLACDVDNQRTKGYSCTAAAQCTTGATQNGEGIGQFFNPAFLAIDPNDILYVADYDNSRIQRFSPDGTFAGQAASTGNGINADTDGGFVLGNMGPPKHVSVNSTDFYVVDQSENFVHNFDTSPFKDITPSSATVTYVSDFAFHSAADTFSYSVNDGLVDSAAAVVNVAVARNYRQPQPEGRDVAAREDRSVVIVLRGTDPDGIASRDFNGLDELTFEIVEQPAFGRLEPGGDPGDVTIDPGMAVWTYTPDRDYFGPDAFTFTVHDAFTDEAFDGATPIPEPYGAAGPATVNIDVESVNDSPIVRIETPERVAAGFPLMLSAKVYDDFGTTYDFTLHWGDGSVSTNGEMLHDDNGTPNDVEDDTVTLSGVVYSKAGLNNIGESPVNALHTYTSAGDRTIRLCMRDAGRLETCSSIEVTVEPLVALSVGLELSHPEIVDGLLFETSIDLENAVPSGGVAGLAADNVTLQMEIPEVLTVQSHTTDTGSCAVAAGMFECAFGTLASGAAPSVNLVLHGNGTLLHDRTLVLDAVLTTDTPALVDTFISSRGIDLLAVNLDRDGDGLPNIFEAVHDVAEPDADEDGDGLTNLEEFEAGTSPRQADSDGDGIGDGDELNLHGSDPLQTDSDDDGLPDADELNVHGTDPASDDSDGDGMRDNWELDNGFDPTVADGDGDADGDGLSDAEEFAHGSDHLDPDTDGDGLDDGEEVNAYDTDPAVADSDEDGLDDGDEIAAGTLPNKPDSDDDGLLDGTEVHVAATDPLLADTDRDGLPDGYEYLNERLPGFPDYRLAAGGLSSCALTDAGVECWGRNDRGQAPSVVPGLDDPQALTVGFVHACALDRHADNTNEVVCWGDNAFGQSTVPALNDPVQVAAGGYHNCALDRQPDTSLALVCWGRDENGAVSAAPTDLEQPLQLVSTISGSGSCVLDRTASGTELRCWGHPDVATDPPAEFGDEVAALALGHRHGCIVAGGERRCWGLNDDGQAPPGPFASQAVEVSLGGFHSCALERGDEETYGVACWGRNVDGQASVPESLERPLNLASGSHHSCALDSGSAKCWGVETQFDEGQAPAERQLAIDPDSDGVPTAEELANGTSPIDADTDRDGIDDAAEHSLETDPTNPDTDGDGVADGDEVNVHGTDPFAGDSDGDGIPDDWEIANGLDPLVDDAGADADGDGLTNLDEHERETDPQRVDTDGDGLDDGQEVGFEPAGTLDPTERDTDGDGVYDGWELEHGFDPANADDGDFDTDGDGLPTWREFNADTDPLVADSDGDGMPDGFEVDNGLDPLQDDSGLDLDRDGATNLDEYLSSGAVQADDVPPVLTPPGDVVANATGVFTDVPLGTATAVDARDGEVVPEASDTGPFVPGPHVVTWSAEDVSGNRAEADQSVGVIPLVNFGVDQVADEGDVVTVDVLLNGAAVTYPVQVNYAVSGGATNPEDHDAAAGSVMIEAGTAGAIEIGIAADAVFEGEETFTLTMTDVMNGIAGMQSSHTVTITQANVKPVTTITMRQQGRRVTTATRDGGPVTISASVSDPNVADAHTISWSASDAGIFDPADAGDAEYAIDPAALPTGYYRIVADTADNGVPIAASRATTLLSIVATAPVLDAGADSDGDGVDDATEGFGDSDGDRIPDYRDAHDDANVLALDDEGRVLEAQPGHRLLLGESAFRAGVVAVLPEAGLADEVEFGYPNGVADFEVHGVAPGGTALVVMPLSHPLPATAVYRKFAANGWQPFTAVAGNALMSAPGGNGACPAPGDASYVAGLSPLHECVQLLLEDGGPNDADGAADGVIRDPGGVAVPIDVSLSVLAVADRDVTAGSSGNVILALRLTSPSGGVELDGLTLSASGSGDDAAIRNVRLVVDENANGLVDDGETAIASGTYATDDGTIELAMPTPYPVPVGETDLLVAYDF